MASLKAGINAVTPVTLPVAPDPGNSICSALVFGPDLLGYRRERTQ
jgi:hypothetical protein